MFKWLICLFKGHAWAFWGLIAPEGDMAQYEKCQRCGALKGDGNKVLNEWLAKD